MAMDQIERDYNLKIMAAFQNGDDDLARELSVGLSEYRHLYKDRDFEECEEDCE